MNVIEAKSEKEIQEARTLFEEYASWLEISLCFQNFEQELAGLPGEYAPPDGRLLLAFEDDQIVGARPERHVALRTPDDEAAVLANRRLDRCDRSRNRSGSP